MKKSVILESMKTRLNNLVRNSLWAVLMLMVGLIVWGATLQSDGQVLEKAKPEHKQTIKEISEQLKILPVLETNQGHIMRELGIKI